MKNAGLEREDTGFAGAAFTGFVTVGGAAFVARSVRVDCTDAVDEDGAAVTDTSLAVRHGWRSP